MKEEVKENKMDQKEASIDKNKLTMTTKKNRQRKRKRRLKVS